MCCWKVTHIAIAYGLCLKAIQGVYAALQNIGTASIKRLAQQHNAPPQQPAPVKRSEPAKPLEQSSQPQPARKVTAKQSARMQKQQQQKQACT